MASCAHDGYEFADCWDTTSSPSKAMRDSRYTRGRDLNKSCISAAFGEVRDAFGFDDDSSALSQCLSPGSVESDVDCGGDGVRKWREVSGGGLDEKVSSDCGKESRSSLASVRGEGSAPL
jgi:hypothetical protein